MDKKEVKQVDLRKYEEQDKELLERLLGDPEMMKNLGGPESNVKIQERHERYLKSEGCYVIQEAISNVSVGWIGYWEKDWKNQKVWETGWSVLLEHQGKGLATQATIIVLDVLKAQKKHRYVHAFPSVENKASNAICKKKGFTLRTKEQFEYPKGKFMVCNDWEYDLQKRI